MTFEMGQRVRIRSTGELGTVAYQRMAPPDYTSAAAVSVVRDSKRDQIGYVGSIYPAAEVEPVAEGGPEWD